MIENILVRPAANTNSNDDTKLDDTMSEISNFYGFDAPNDGKLRIFYSFRKFSLEQKLKRKKFKFLPDENGSDLADDGFQFPLNTAPDTSNPTSDSIKIESIDDEQLKSVAAYINEPNDASAIVVRPWIHDNDRKCSIDTIRQYALYKCMFEKCLFATDSVKQWQFHMNAHLQLFGHFQSIDKTIRDRLIKFRMCSYCEFQAKSDQQFIWHMEDEHRRSIFQCTNCFYRSIECDNIVSHMKIHHPENFEILLCGEQRCFEQHDKEILKQDRDDFVEKIRCGQGMYFFGMCEYIHSIFGGSSEMIDGEV